MNCEFKLYLLSLLMLVVGCSNETVYFSCEDIPESSWNNSDTVTFHIPKMENKGVYVPTLMVRTNDNYQYQNLNIKVEISGKKVLSTETLTITIFDKEGRNKGDGLVHTEFSRQLAQVTLDTLEYTVKVTNLMTKTPLDGISSVGLRLKHK